MRKQKCKEKASNITIYITHHYGKGRENCVHLLYFTIVSDIHQSHFCFHAFHSFISPTPTLPFPLYCSLAHALHSVHVNCCNTFVRTLFFPALHFRCSLVVRSFFSRWIVGSFKLACHVFLLSVPANTLCRSNGTEWKVFTKCRAMILHELQYFTAIPLHSMMMKKWICWALKCKTLCFDFLWIVGALVVCVRVCVWWVPYSLAHICVCSQANYFSSMVNFNVIPREKQQANEEKEE